MRGLDKIALNGQSECWEWTASKTLDGYGRLRVHGLLWYAHRYFYEEHISEIPPGLQLDHLCRNRSCVNPWHLDPVPKRVNDLRGESAWAENARKTHCVRGHEFTPSNTYAWRGWRACRECRAETQRTRNRKKVG